jgi:hypothetical protein
MENYEQKYKEVLASVKQLADNNPHDEGIQAWVQDNFPELRESEDERIRKELIAHFKTNSVSESWSGLNVNKVLAWLEKQGERKRETIILKFKTGDKVTNGLDTYTIDAIGKDCYWIKEHDCASILFESQHYWKIVEQKDTTCRTTGYWSVEEQKPAWSEEDITRLKSAITLLQNPLIASDEVNNGVRIKTVAWLKSIKDRVQLQPKREWNEKLIADVFEMVGLAKIVREQENDALTEALQSAMIELAKYCVIPQPKQEYGKGIQRRIESNA